MLLIFAVTVMSGVFWYQMEYNNLYFDTQQIAYSSNFIYHAKIFAYIKVENVSNRTVEVVNVSYLSLNLYNNFSTPFNLTNISIGKAVLLNKSIPVKPLENVTVFIKIPFNVSLSNTYNVSFIITAGWPETYFANASVENVSLKYLKGIVSVERAAVIANINGTNYLGYYVINLSPYPVTLKEVEINGEAQCPDIVLSPLQQFSGNMTLSFSIQRGHFYAVSFTFENANGEEEIIKQNATILEVYNQTATEG